MLGTTVGTAARVSPPHGCVRNWILLAVSAITAAFPVLGAETPTRPAERDAGSSVYHRLTEEWACATVRLYSHMQSAVPAETLDWGEHWRMVEVEKALQSLPDHSTCMSVPDLEAIKALIKTQAIAELREQEFLRLLWLKAKLSQMDYDPRYPDSSLVPATVKGMQALGWGDKQILAAVTGRNALESRMLANALFESVSQEVKSEKEPYRDPTMKELQQKLPATVGAAADAAQAAVNSARHQRPAQPGALPPPVSP